MRKHQCRDRDHDPKDRKISEQHPAIWIGNKDVPNDDRKQLNDTDDQQGNGEGTQIMIFHHQMQADQNEQPAQQHEQIRPVVQAVILLHVKFLNDLQIKTANCKKAGPGIDRNNHGIDQVSK